MRRRALLMGGKSAPNTIIGGVGSVITTKSALATKLGISESIISAFKIVGNDVQARITENYLLPNQLFFNDSDILSFLDYDGMVSNFNGVSHFQNSTIKRAILPSLTTTSNFMFDGSQVEEAELISATIITNNALRNTPIHTLNAPLITNIQTSGLANTTNLINFNATGLTNVGQFGLNNTASTPDTTSITSIGNSGMRNMKYIVLDLNSLTTFSGTGNRSISDMTLCVNSYINNLETAPDSSNFFTNWTSAELIEMKKLKTYGALAAGGGNGTTYGFATLKTGCVIRVNEALATANAGSPHEAFLWVKANRGATVEFYDDSGNYVNTL